ncbi:MAG: methionyl-tRNA formyltransferase [Cryomorphaceae bacterium]|jgi:methionyl-tRNA formyltransferase
MKILFAGTPHFAVAPLLALANSHDVVGVFTQPDRKAGRGKKLSPPPVKLAALEEGFTVHQPSSLKDQAHIVQSLEPDAIVVVAYGMLLPQNILQIPTLGCINIHASILPRWRGAAPIQRAIQAGDKKTGVSIMQMELGLDTGPVYRILETQIDDSDTSDSLHKRLAALGAQGIVDVLAELSINPNLQPQAQDDQYANYAKKIHKSEALIDWNISARELDQKIRAFNPWPICQTEHKGSRIRIWQAAVSIDHSSSAKPGQILGLSDQSVVVACGDGALELRTLQRDGSRPLGIKEFCNGYTLAIGDALGSC